MPGDARERNEALFREVNERIEDVSTALVPDDEPMEFLCECDDTDSLVKPGAAETCNLRDDNCDGRVDNVGVDQTCQ